ncbi:hypothetical protein AMC75_12480 [Staphylococcus carnosus]|uniref:O-antigen ligase family protein n=1 Tax=Staphylococcus TaxID=1279 RepID=UPI0006AB9E5C|nr:MULTISPECIES: O-antigen ligase family protein [Staphylococcus]KOR11801.1 hypothetical protein AMC75_12480 [Staphylococcus carnosus]MBU8680715.1 O-antigen ligase family protein [Staphylococcus saprophyticus]MVA85005.1 hypothetical protein [Staphylococcus saprophyticus]
MKKLIQMIFSGEMYFTLFLTAGIFKSNFNWFPLDITILFFILTAIVILKRLFLKPKIYIAQFFAILLMLLIVALMLLTYTYAPKTSYALTKTVSFIIFSFGSFVFSLFLFSYNLKKIQKFFEVFVLVSTLLSIIAIIEYFYPNQFLSVGLNTGIVIGLARAVGISCIINLSYFLISNKEIRIKILCLSSLLLNISALILTASRMAIISVVISWILLIFLSTKIKNKKIYVDKNTKIIVPIFIFVIAFTIYLYIKGAFDKILFRMTVLINESNGGTSLNGRFDRYETALHMFIDKPIFGNGIGSFSYVYGGVTASEYPHNIFLEVISEMGLIGLIGLLFLIVYVIYRYIKINTDKSYETMKLSVSILLISLFLFLSVNSSGDLVENRIFFAILGLIISYSISFRLDDKKL